MICTIVVSTNVFKSIVSDNRLGHMHSPKAQRFAYCTTILGALRSVAPLSFSQTRIAICL